MQAAEKVKNIMINIAALWFNIFSINRSFVAARVKTLHHHKNSFNFIISQHLRSAILQNELYTMNLNSSVDRFSNY